MKDRAEVIKEFGEFVNMSSSELESWLKSDESEGAGWHGDNTNGNTETVGHESGRKIVEILKDNPQRKPEDYSDDQIEHMRKVVAYCKRHLAQETKGNNQKSSEDVKTTKSYKSLKNWGHDFLKAQNKAESGADEEGVPGPSAKSTGTGKTQDNAIELSDDEQEEESGDDEKHVVRKRKDGTQPTGANKKRKTRSGSSTKESPVDADEEEKAHDREQGKAVDATEDEEQDDEEDGEDDSHQKDEEGKEFKNGPAKGDTVSWNWGNGKPQGQVVDVKGEKTSITTKRGNEVTRNGTSDDPAVVIDTGKSTAIKSAHELN